MSEKEDEGLVETPDPCLEYGNKVGCLEMGLAGFAFMKYVSELLGIVQRSECYL